MTGAEYLDLGEHDRHVVATQMLADRVPTMVAGVRVRQFVVVVDRLVGWLNWASAQQPERTLDDLCTVAVDQSIARAVARARG